MAASFSFRNQAAARPPRYRTPSPPRFAVEPLSPLVSSFSFSSSSPDFHHHRPNWKYPADSTVSNVSSVQNQNAAVGSARPHRHSPGREADYLVEATVNNNNNKKKNKNNNNNLSGGGGGSSSHKPPSHSRSGSTIDTLATIALATSPTFAPLVRNDNGQSVAHPVQSLNPYAVPDESAERPSKRARSEKAPSPTWQKLGTRPSTSHMSTFDSMKTDAELLLNFARPNHPFPSSSSNPRHKINQQNEPQTPGPKRGGDPTWLRNGHWNAPNARFPSTTTSSTGVMASRMRSRSDGSAMAARPMINGFVGHQGGNQRGAPIDAAVEDDPNVLDQQPVTRTSEPEPNRLADRNNLVPSLPVPPSDNDAETDSSGQAQCASCNLARVPIDDGGDDAEVTWVNCDGCDGWFHIVCAGFKNYREVRTVDKFICRDCHPTHGPTTFLRKSSRPRTAIDYAGLNQGFIKSSVEAPEHHYIRPIKEGKISFLPDNFARMPPETVTAQYFQYGIGMTEPIVVPSYLNSRTPAVSIGANDDRVPLEEPVDQEEFDHTIATLEALYDTSETVVDCGQDAIDMVIPDNLNVRTVAELYGPDEAVEVIDVKSQQGEDKKWTMRKWVDYYYESSSAKPVRNVISLEISQSPLGRLIRRPKIVRDLDLQDSVWPSELQAAGDYPKVQFYCLMSVADCYTDFHIDFGGSSVYYHILKGKKTFFFIPPRDKHLKKYEEWCNSTSQDTTFLGDQTKECYRVDLSEGDTMLIPSGWIHAVWTPEDSLVIGGNFLTRTNYAMQIKVAKIEKDTKVPMKFRYPFFQKIMWYTVLKYLTDDPIPLNVLSAFSRDENYRFYRQYPIYYEFGERVNTAERGSDYYNTQFYSQAELEGLPELSRYILRTALIAGGYPVDGVAKEARYSVNRSIPKGQGDPVDIARKFGIWVAWKRGNEPAPEWTHSGAISMVTKFDLLGKVSGRRRSERNTKLARSDQPQGLDSRPAVLNSKLSGTVFLSPTNPVSQNKPKGLNDSKPKSEEGHRVVLKPTGLGPKRIACDACRKRRIRCRHKIADEAELEAFVLAQRDPSAAVSSSQKSSVIAAGSTVLAKNSSDYFVSDRKNSVRPGDPTTNDSSPSQGFERFQDNHTTMRGPTIDQLNLVKRNRSKACDECRKSKRRCIHDESGRIDPEKSQGQPRPRGSNISKPGLFSDDERRGGENLYASILEAKLPPEISVGDDGRGVTGAVTATSSLVSPPTSLSDDMENSTLDGRVCKATEAAQPNSTPGTTVNLNLNNPLIQQTGNPNSSPSAAEPNSPRHSTTASDLLVSPKRLLTDNTVVADDGWEKLVCDQAQPAKGVKRDRSVLTDISADPESLKLIRELQEQEFGLRKRSSRS